MPTPNQKDSPDFAENDKSPIKKTDQTELRPEKDPDGSAEEKNANNLLDDTSIMEPPGSALNPEQHSPPLDEPKTSTKVIPRPSKKPDLTALELTEAPPANEGLVLELRQQISGSLSPPETPYSDRLITLITQLAPEGPLADFACACQIILRLIEAPAAESASAEAENDALVQAFKSATSTIQSHFSAGTTPTTPNELLQKLLASGLRLDKLVGAPRRQALESIFNSLRTHYENTGSLGSSELKQKIVNVLSFLLGIFDQVEDCLQKNSHYEPQFEQLYGQCLEICGELLLGRGTAINIALEKLETTSVDLLKTIRQHHKKSAKDLLKKHWGAESLSGAEDFTKKLADLNIKSDRPEGKIFIYLLSLLRNGASAEDNRLLDSACGLAGTIISLLQTNSKSPEIDQLFAQLAATTEADFFRIAHEIENPSEISDRDSLHPLSLILLQYPEKTPVTGTKELSQEISQLVQNKTIPAAGNEKKTLTNIFLLLSSTESKIRSKKERQKTQLLLLAGLIAGALKASPVLDEQDNKHYHQFPNDISGFLENCNLLELARELSEEGPSAKLARVSTRSYQRPDQLRKASRHIIDAFRKLKGTTFIGKEEVKQTLDKTFNILLEADDRNRSSALEIGRMSKIENESRKIKTAAIKVITHAEKKGAGLLSDQCKRSIGIIRSTLQGINIKEADDIPDIKIALSLEKIPQTPTLCRTLDELEACLTEASLQDGYTPSGNATVDSIIGNLIEEAKAQEAHDDEWLEFMMVAACRPLWTDQNLSENTFDQLIANAETNEQPVTARVATALQHVVSSHPDKLLETAAQTIAKILNLTDTNTLRETLSMVENLLQDTENTAALYMVAETVCKRFQNKDSEKIRKLREKWRYYKKEALQFKFRQLFNHELETGSSPNDAFIKKQLSQNFPSEDVAGLELLFKKWQQYREEQLIDPKPSPPENPDMYNFAAAEKYTLALLGRIIFTPQPFRTQESSFERYFDKLLLGHIEGSFRNIDYIVTSQVASRMADFDRRVRERQEQLENERKKELQAGGQEQALTDTDKAALEAQAIEEITARGSLFDTDSLDSSLDDLFGEETE